MGPGGTGGGSSSGDIKLTGLRVSAVITVVGGATAGTMQLAIYGMPLSLMNQLSSMGYQYTQQNHNSISVLAGDKESGMSLVYTGLIYNAYVDAQSMPQVCFRITGSPGGGYHATKPIPPTSKSGPQDVATQLLAPLAKQMGLQFENNGVNTKLTNPYYPSSAWNQALAIAQDAGIHMVVERGVMAVVPAGGNRSGTIEIAPPQMVAYPAFRDYTIVVKAKFNAAVKALSIMHVTSDLTAACGNWSINSITYELESETPRGRWFMTLVGTQAGKDKSPPT